MLLQKRELIKVMTLLKPGLARKDIIETFTHYLFTGEEMVTFNDEVSISHPFKTDFQFSARAEELFKIVNGIKEDTLEITKKENEISIKSSRTKATLAVTEGVEAKQLVDTLDLKNVVPNMKELPQDFIHGAFLCMFSASKDMTKGMFTCVKVDDQVLYSSDGIRVSRYELRNPTGMQILIPARNVEELCKFPITKCCLTDSWCHFGTDDGVVFSSRIMEGEYPKLDQYFDTVKDGRKVMLPAELRELIESVTFMTDGKIDKDKNIDLTIEKDRISCKGEKKQIGWVEREIEFKYEQEPILVTINPIFLHEVLGKATVMRVTNEAAMFISSNFKHLLSLV